MIQVDWSVFKGFIDDRGLSVQYVDTGNAYHLRGVDAAFILGCSLDKVTPAPVGSDQKDFEDNYKTAGNKKIDLRTDVQKIPRVAVYRPEGSSSTVISHDWTDKSTWYNKSTRVTGETLTLDTGKIYDFANQNIIDLTHGRLYDEDAYLSGHELKVYDNAVLKTEDTDYTMNYTTGKVTFDAAYTVTGPVTADYSYASGSEWVLKPATGKVLHIEHAELQFSANVDMSPVAFEIWVYNPADLPNKIKYQEIIYKNIKDVIGAANLGQGYIPSIDILTQNIIVFPFNYATVKSLKDSDGAELRVRILDDQPFLGEFATATFYVLSEDL